MRLNRARRTAPRSGIPRPPGRPRPRPIRIVSPSRNALPGLVVPGLYRGHPRMAHRAATRPKPGGSEIQARGNETQASGSRIQASGSGIQMIPFHELSLLNGLDANPNSFFLPVPHPPPDPSRRRRDQRRRFDHEGDPNIGSAFQEANVGIGRNRYRQWRRAVGPERVDTGILPKPSGLARCCARRPQAPMLKQRDDLARGCQFLPSRHARHRPCPL